MSTIECSSLFLDVNRIKITQDGVEDFYWPIHPHEINKIYLKLIRDLVVIIRSSIKENITGYDEAIILYSHFAHEAVCAHQANVLIRRAMHDDYEVVASSCNRLVSAFLKDEIPELPPKIFNNLRNGPARVKWWRLPLRIARDAWLSFSDGIRRRKFLPIHYKKYIVTTTVDKLVVAYVKKHNNNVFFCRFNNWFSKPQTEELSNSDYRQIGQRFLHEMRRILQETPDGLSPLVDRYMSHWVDEAFPLVGYYSKQLLEKPQLIPQSLWTHTAGNIWVRILSRYVRKNGGEVTRFSHGSGGGYFKESHEQACIEFDDCDTFITLSKAQAATFAETFTGKDLVQKKPPAFIEISNKNPICVQKKIPRYNNKKIRIMYVATVYTNEHVYTSSNGLMSGITLLDWETRLISKLKNWDFEPLLKPHPSDELSIAAPESITQLHGSIIINDSFEDALNKADIVLFDYPSSTTFLQLLFTNIPIVYLDFEISRFNNTARNLLNRRMPIIKGWYDDKNRAHINWDELYNAILACREYKDSSFAKTYFGL